MTKDNKSEPTLCEAREVNEFLKFLRENSSADIPAKKKKAKKAKQAKKAAEAIPAVDDDEPISKDEL